MLKFKQLIRLNLNFVPCMTRKKKKINVQCLKKKHFFNDKLYILLLFTKV